MSYQVLARKWRPRRFSEMVGQEHVLQALVNALDHDRLHHAYLFTGTRGVGKTTIARILAKSLNCETGVSSEPCGTCSSCTEIAEGRSVDLLEVDAASRTKVEDTRDLLENVQYAPTRSRYKVYLIDEVHMLSNSSFNALLKTLEEPPPHVKFLLATTDPQKLPATVLSRCLQFNLKNMVPEQIAGHLGQVLEAEMIRFEEPALWLLGRAADGSMRDALSLTDQAIAFGSGSITEAGVRSMLGTVDMSFVYQLLDALAAGEPATLLETVAHMAEHAPDFESSLEEMQSLLHRITVAQVLPELRDNSRGDAERIEALAGKLTAEDVQLFYQMALNGKRDLPHAADPRSGFEMTLLRMLAFRPALLPDSGAGGSNESSAERSDSGSEKGVRSTFAPAERATVGEGAAKPDPTPAASTEPAPAGPAPQAQPAPPAATTSAHHENGVRSTFAPPAAATPAPRIDRATAPQMVAPEDWPDLLAKLGLAGIVQNIASHCVLQAQQGSDFQFVLDDTNLALFNPGHADRIRLALQNYFDTPVSVSIEPGRPQLETPAQRSARRAAERQLEAEQAIEHDPLLQQLIQRFDGELDRASITPLDS
ncbi:DNA polymerase III subunit gamma/tau [Haliea sp. E1-2-M8]|uniref:DNA polymerase III subunit gamma/tau n=1 Tax=Haliea sp. E1-2-M8 TaxID=3064706 RepID=UPI00271A9DE1|nr:DNA polymerase III subunit gamma/tau [Haliea sp. E1-2-M8]MDO8862428.1 DNA polymerase III subunit gamma/tau [Haliea sp. E1-2-M8]